MKLLGRKRASFLPDHRHYLIFVVVVVVVVLSLYDAIILLCLYDYVIARCTSYINLFVGCLSSISYLLLLLLLNLSIIWHDLKNDSRIINYMNGSGNLSINIDRNLTIDIDRISLLISDNCPCVYLINCTNLQCQMFISVCAYCPMIDCCIRPSSTSQ